MNWKERPELFCNGKFEAKASFKDDEILKKDWYENKGLITKVDIHNRIWLGNDVDGVQIMYCTLIARPISDMSDEEMKNVPSFEGNVLSFKHRETMLIREIKSKTLLAVDERYLLSIGVYPFDQSHFKTGEVIPRYEND